MNSINKNVAFNVFLITTREQALKTEDVSKEGSNNGKLDEKMDVRMDRWTNTDWLTDGQIHWHVKVNGLILDRFWKDRKKLGQMDRLVDEISIQISYRV